MDITLKKTEHRSELTCTRADGSQTTVSRGPGIVYHDLAHFVAETRLGLRRGFWGNIEAGHSLAELSDQLVELSNEEVIAHLGSDACVAEILARALGALSFGMGSPERFPVLLGEETARLGIPCPDQVTPDSILAMVSELKALMGQFDALDDDESLALTFG